MIETRLKRAILRKQNVKFVILSWADGRTTCVFYSYVFLEKQRDENYSVADLFAKGYPLRSIGTSILQGNNSYLQHLTV
jgi:hypothetical protein